MRYAKNAIEEKAQREQKCRAKAQILFKNVWLSMESTERSSCICTMVCHGPPTNLA